MNNDDSVLREGEVRVTLPADAALKIRENVFVLFLSFEEQSLKTKSSTAHVNLVGMEVTTMTVFFAET